MKMICIQCGCHFPEEFEQTLKPPCNFWGDHGASNLPENYKQMVWDWLFTMPVDKIAIETLLAFKLSWEFTPQVTSNDFAVLVPNWNDLSEDEKKKYQKEYFRKIYQGNGPEKLEKAKRIN